MRVATSPRSVIGRAPGNFPKSGPTAKPLANILRWRLCLQRSALRMAGKSWSFADDRRVIELAKASKSLKEAARIMKRTPERIRKVSMRLGVSFKTARKKKRIQK